MPHGLEVSTLTLTSPFSLHPPNRRSYGIATAICSQLLSRGCLTLFATHFHELTALADQQPGVGNKHVAAHVDGNDLTMLFKVQTGAGRGWCRGGGGEGVGNKHVAAHVDGNDLTMLFKVRRWGSDAQGGGGRYWWGCGKHVAAPGAGTTGHGTVASPPPADYHHPPTPPS